MNIEITNVSLSPTYFSEVIPELVDEIGELCVRSSSHLMMCTRAAYANRGGQVYRVLVAHSKCITKPLADRIAEIVSCSQYTDERVCAKVIELLCSPKNQRGITPLVFEN